VQICSIIFGGDVVGKDIPFQRVPVPGELVSHPGQWFQVESVAHAWLGPNPIAAIHIVAASASHAVGPALFPSAFGPIGPFPHA
jgi:hypothetical protein